MAAQFGRVPLASPLAPDFGTGAASAIPLLQTPFNVSLEGTLSRLLSGVRVPPLSSVGHPALFAMAGDVTRAEFLFAAARAHLPDIFVV